MLADIFPITLPIKYGAVILPDELITTVDRLAMLPRLEVILPLLSITNTGGIPTVTPPTKPKGSNAIVHPNLVYNIFICQL